MLNGKFAKHICILIGFLIFLCFFRFLSLDLGSSHYPAKIISITDKSEEYNAGINNQELKNPGITYIEIATVSFIKSGNEMTTKVRINRHKEEKLPRVGDTIKIQLLNNGNVCEYQPVKTILANMVLIFVGASTILIGIFGKTANVNKELSTVYLE